MKPASFFHPAQPMVGCAARRMAQKYNLYRSNETRMMELRCSVSARALRFLAWLCAAGNAPFMLASCHYSEEQLWEECRILKVHTDETSSSESRIAILELGAHRIFTGDGRRGLSLDESRHREKVERELNNFLDGNAGTSPRDYFTGLGMACGAATRSDFGAMPG